MHSAVSQLFEGRYVNIRSIAELDPALRFRSDQLQASTVLSSGALDIELTPFRFAPEGAEARLSEVGQIAREVDPEAFRLADDIEPRITDTRTRADQAAIEAQSKSEVEILKAADKVTSLDQRLRDAKGFKEAKALEKKKRTIIKANGGEEFGARVATAKKAATEAQTKVDNLSIELGFLTRELSNLEPRIERATNTAVQRATSKAETNLRFKQVQADAVKNNSPESIRLANFMASSEAAEQFARIPETQSFKEAQIELDGATEQVVSLAEKLGLDEDLDELAEFDEIIQNSHAQARAVRAAALCDLRR